MQFQSIIAVLAMAVVATAAPSPSSYTAPDPQCATNQTTACCPSTLVGILPIDLPCFALDIIGFLDPTCPVNQQLACCDAAPQMDNFIAIGTICAPLSAS